MRFGSKGAGQASGTARSKKKGDRPGHLDQKLWAPLHYCAFWNAGVFVSMMNKMGSWDMPINYAVKVSFPSFIAFVPVFMIIFHLT
jgi:hypothetical protein